MKLITITGVADQYFLCKDGKILACADTAAKLPPVPAGARVVSIHDMVRGEGLVGAPDGYPMHRILHWNEVAGPNNIDISQTVIDDPTGTQTKTV